MQRKLKATAMTALGQTLPSHSALARINVCFPRKRPNRGQVVNDEKGQQATNGTAK
jgi:hypothetical protein